MTSPPRRATLCLCLLSGACSYDWTVPPNEGIGGLGGAATTTTTSTGGDGGVTSQGGAGVGGEGGIGGAGGAGGAEDVCATSPADSACQTCVKAGCCAELMACAGDVQCDCYRLCYAAPTANCFIGCGLMVTPGTPTSDLVTCAQTNSCAACLP